MKTGKPMISLFLILTCGLNRVFCRYLNYNLIIRIHNQNALNAFIKFIGAVERPDLLCFKRIDICPSHIELVNTLNTTYEALVNRDINPNGVNAKPQYVSFYNDSLNKQMEYTANIHCEYK